MFITILLIVCTNVNVPGTCFNTPVVDNQVNPEVTMGSCMGIDGLEAAKEKYENSLELKSHFQFKGWACSIGNKKLPARGGA